MEMDISLFSAVIFQALLILPIICMQTFLYAKTIGLSQKWKGIRLVFAILLFTLIEVAIQLVVSNVSGLSWLSLFIVALLILYPVLFMGGSLKERTLYGVVNCAIFLFSILISITIMFAEILRNRSATPWHTALLVIALMMTVHAILVLVIMHFTTEGKRYMPRKYWIGLIIGFSIIAVGLFAVDYLNAWMADAGKLHTYLTLFTVGFLIVWLLLYFVFYFICRYFTKATEANALAIQNDMIERYMLRKQASDERIQMLSHDLKHSLTQWRAFAEEKGDARALECISAYEGQLRFALMINVENENANAIINQKYWEANQQHVEIQVVGVFHKDLLISMLDLCALLGNLLDNAIEAAAQVETETLRRVRLSISRKGNLLLLTAENGYAVEPVIENGSFVTHKKDKGCHAIGMRSIKYVAEKYDGAVHHSYEDNWFKSTVMLRGYKTALSDNS